MRNVRYRTGHYGGRTSSIDHTILRGVPFGPGPPVSTGVVYVKTILVTRLNENDKSLLGILIGTSHSSFSFTVVSGGHDPTPVVSEGQGARGFRGKETVVGDVAYLSLVTTGGV